MAIDNNNDGIINNVSELFGDDQYKDGFAKLASFDTNNDNVIDRNDADFAQLKTWQDKNSDGFTDAGELKTLEQAGMRHFSGSLAL